MIENLVNQSTQTDLNPILITSTILLLTLLIIHFITFQVLKRFSKRKDNNITRDSYRKFKLPGLIFFITVSLSYFVSTVGPENELLRILNHSLNVIIIFMIAWLVIRFIGLGKELVLKQFDVDEKDNLKARKVYTQFKIIERILITIVVIIALAAALMTFESIRKIGVSLFASAGVAGIILGFAAQSLIGNVLAGFQLALAQPIRLDDVVIVEGEWGWIEEINITYVVIRIWDKRRLIVPTKYFIEKPFQNWTRTSAEILGTVFIYTDYTVPVGAIREELTRILKDDPLWDGKVNNLQVTNATDKAIEIRALMSASDSPKAWDLRVGVREKLIEFLQNNYPESLPRVRIEVPADSPKA